MISRNPHPGRTSRSYLTLAMWASLTTLCACIAFKTGESRAFPGPQRWTRLVDSVDWKQLTEQCTDEGKAAGVKSIELRFQGHRLMELQYGPEHKAQRFTYATDTPSTLKIIEKVCNDSEYWPLRPARADSSRIGGGWSGSVLGELTIHFANGAHVDIAITLVGFSLGKGSPNIGDRFFSTLLALEVDNLYLAQTGRHLPAKLIDTLSGAERMSAERRLFHKIRRQPPTTPESPDKK